jgi:hypothetical protein
MEPDIELEWNYLHVGNTVDGGWVRTAYRCKNSKTIRALACP